MVFSKRKIQALELTLFLAAFAGLLMSFTVVYASGLSENNVPLPFHLSAVPSESSDGKILLSWQNTSGFPVQIQQSRTSSFASPMEIYTGKDSASVITGLMDGQYFYRGKLNSEQPQNSGWSEPVVVQVKHHSLFKAFSFFLIGAVVFIATLGLILNGHFRTDSEKQG